MGGCGLGVDSVGVMWGIFVGGVASYSYTVGWYFGVLFNPRAVFNVICPRFATKTKNRPLSTGIWPSASRASVWSVAVLRWKAQVGFYVTGE